MNATSNKIRTIVNALQANGIQATLSVTGNIDLEIPYSNRTFLGLVLISSDGQVQSVVAGRSTTRVWRIIRAA